MYLCTYMNLVTLFKRLFLLPVFSCLFCNASYAELADSSFYLVKKTPKPIKVDGMDHEELWEVLEPMKGFVQNFPTDTLSAKSVTEVKMCYDDKNIYVFAFMHDTSSKSYIVQSLKRDFSITRSDAFIMTIAPQRDKMNGFSFGVNPYGVQREGLVATGGAQGVTTAWDNKWFSETRRVPGGWVTEFSIPLKTLRYKKGSTDWDVNFARFDYKRNENSTWVKIPRNFNLSHLGFTGTLHFEEPLKKAGSNIVFIPYATGGVSFNYTGPQKPKLRNLANAGFDAKVGLTSSLNLDLTLNPDFSQVEIDDQVINLDRFEVFFPERRQFFIENSDLFDAFGFSKIRPFFSRRIGLYKGQNVPIIAGVRLSGNLNRDWRIGLMNLQTLAKPELGLPAQNYTVAAAQRRVFNRSNVSFIAVNKQSFAKGIDAANQHNTLAGVDFNLLSKNSKWQGKIFYHHTFGSKVQIDANANASWLTYKTSKVSVMWNHEYVGKYYNAEVGFVPRTGYFRLEPDFNYTFFMKKGPLFYIRPDIYYSQYWSTTDWKSTDRINRASVDFSFKSSALLSISFTDAQTRLIRNFDPSGKGINPILAGNYLFRYGSASYTSNFRKKFTYYLFANAGTYFDRFKVGYGGSVAYRFQPYGSIAVNAERNEILDMHGGKNVHITLIGNRIDVSFTKEVFFTNILQYNTQQNVFNINTRLQWRFRPMSDLFIVYTDNYDDRFQQRIRAFQIKLSFWLNV